MMGDAERAESDFRALGAGIAAAEASQMFGKKCFKIGGKAFICLFHDCAVFKLTGAAHGQALALAGAVLFDPSGSGRAMKEWVQVPHLHQALWPAFAAQALAYVGGV